MGSGGAWAMCSECAPVRVSVDMFYGGVGQLCRLLDEDSNAPERPGSLNIEIDLGRPPRPLNTAIVRRGAECYSRMGYKGWRVRSPLQHIVVGFGPHTLFFSTTTRAAAAASWLASCVCDDAAGTYIDFLAPTQTIHPSPRGHNDSDVRLTILGTPHGHTVW